MKGISQYWRRLRYYLRRDRFDRELEEEMRFHLEMKTNHNVAVGMSQQEAASAAKRDFGNRTLLQELSREVWGVRSIEVLLQDLRYGTRMLLRNPSLTVIAVVTLALGIGANSAIFTLLDKVLIRRLPVEEPEQLVTFVDDLSGAPRIFSYPAFAEMRDDNNVLSGLAAYWQRPFSLSDGSRSERVTGQIVSGNYFEVLGVRPALGRFFLPEEDRTPGSHPVIVIGHGLWQRRFAADPSVIGKRVNVNGYSYVVVGITPAEFTGTTRGTVNDVYVPMMMQAQTGTRRNGFLENRNAGWLQLIGRLKPGVSRQQAQASLSVLVNSPESTSPDPKQSAMSFPAILLMDGSRGYTVQVQDLALPLKLLMGAVGLVLLISCANVGNLLMARASARRKEIAVRMAIGAGRVRLVRQLFTEGLILSVLGGAAGLLVAHGLTSLLLSFQQQTTYVPRIFDGSLDWRALGFTLAVSLLTGILFSLAPAIVASKTDFGTALKDDTRLRGGKPGQWGMRYGLVIVQVALSLVVLIGAGLCVKSWRALQAIDPGFEPARVVTASFDLSQSGYDEPRGRQFISQLSERIAVLPGVEAVSLGTIPAFSDSFWISRATPEGYQPQPGERLEFDLNAISPNYFHTLGAHLLSGREFTTRDTSDAARVVIINEAAARRYWPGTEPVGKRITRGRGEFSEIVGVVRNGREKGLTADPRPALYLPLLQNYVRDQSLTLHVRTATNAQTLLSAVRREVQSLDPHLALFNMGTLAQQKEGSLYGERLAATLFTLFGLLALLLAAVGIYGVLSYAVTERTRELGIRLAIGAQPRDLIKLIIGQGLILTLIGAATGVAAAFALTRLMTKLLFGVSPTDLLTFLMVPLVLACVAVLACWIPARRASRLNPLVTLKYE